MRVGHLCISAGKMCSVNGTSREVSSGGRTGPPGDGVRRVAEGRVVLVQEDGLAQRQKLTPARPPCHLYLRRVLGTFPQCYTRCLDYTVTIL